jgi:hypothetical protein
LKVIPIKNVEIMAILRKFLFLAMAAIFGGRQDLDTVLKEDH